MCWGAASRRFKRGYKNVISKGAELNNEVWQIALGAWRMLSLFIATVLPASLVPTHRLVVVVVVVVTPGKVVSVQCAEVLFGVVCRLLCVLAGG